MKAKSFFEQNGGTYTQVGEVLLPDLVVESSEQRPIGKYGRMRKRYLKEQHPLLYSELLLSGEIVSAPFGNRRHLRGAAGTASPANGQERRSD